MCILQVVQDLISCLDSSELPFLQWQECFAVLATRLPKDLRIMVNTYVSFVINVIPFLHYKTFNAFLIKFYIS